MIYILLSGTLSAFFSIFYKLSHRKKCNIQNVYHTLFLTSGIYSIFLLILFPEGQGWPSTVILLGMAAGICYYSAVIMYFKIMRFGLHSILWTVINMSISIPVVASLFIWRETPSLWQGCGLAGIFIAFIFLGLNQLQMKSNHDNMTNRSNWWQRFVCVAISFIGSGLALLCSKVLIQQGYADFKIHFTFIVYTSAAILSVPFISYERILSSKKDFIMGASMAFFGVTAYILLILALYQIEAFIVFPLRSVVNIMLAIILSIVLWREKIGRLGWVGLCIAIISIVLIS